MPGGQCLFGGEIYSSFADMDPGPATYTLNYLDGGDAFVSSLNTSGNFDFAFSITGSDEGWVNQLTPGPGNSLFLGGSFKNMCDFDPSPATTILTSSGQEDVFIMKFAPGIPTRVETNYKNDFELFPNPAHNSISTRGMQPGTVITCYNECGLQLFQIKPENNSFEISQLSNGIYLLKTENADGQVRYFKLIKE
jgi:hypothetical protein